MLPVTHTKVRVRHLHNHQSAAFGAVTRETIMATRVMALLNSQQHGWRLQGHQLT